MKYSKQRETILQNVLHRLDHPTADMVYQSVQKELPNISLGTVYRNLNHLADMGAVKKIGMPIGSDRFDGTLEDHYHINCHECCEFYDLPIHALKDVNHLVEDETGYKILSHNIVFMGICHTCQEKKEG